MSKKKKNANGSTAADNIATSNDASNANTNGGTSTKHTSKHADPHPPSLTISRNKHWRYISAFHGPWLQLPHEILETLAHSNFLSPRPRQNDPAVLYDLLKIRRLVDEATDLTVRAQNGTASSALSNSQNASNGLQGGALGLTGRGAGANAKLSPERRYRMRELATQKLATAYRLDEVAASVATMQSASTLDSVASLVLQRAPENPDAKYVHFFHEKIPSRMMAEWTPLTQLDEVIAYAPGHAAPYRTRALTKIFKDDHVGAIRDLTEALALSRLDMAKHKAGRSQQVSMKDAKEETERRKVWTRDWVEENKVADDDQPSGLEMQLLFQRGNQYLTMACKYIRIALGSFEAAEREKASRLEGLGDAEEPQCATSTEMEAYQRGLDARETLRKYAKRALRDYTAFFAELDYAYTPTQYAGETFEKQSVRGGIPPRSLSSSRLIEIDDYDEDDQAQSLTSTALATTTTTSSSTSSTSSPRPKSSSSRTGYSPPSIPPPSTHPLSTILSASPPPSLPPFPPPQPTTLILSTFPTTTPPLPTYTELLTYHPLLPESLHAHLLTHALLQTPTTTLSRIALNTSRLARLADGYPFFLAARSPARADWAEILRKTRNWVGLPGSWDLLCRPPGEEESGVDARQQRQSRRNGVDAGIAVAEKPRLSAEQKADLAAKRRERIRKEAVMEALGDERVVDDETFQRAVEARERRALEDMEMDDGAGGGGGFEGGNGEKKDETTDGHDVKRPAAAKAAAVAKDEEYLIGTERAEGIAAWVLRGPTVVEGVPSRPRKGRKKVRKAEGESG